jgi:Zinc carboxypeptidase
MMIERIFILLFALIGSATTIPQTRALTVSDFFGDFEGASLVNPKQLGPNHFALETQSVEKFGGQGRLGVWVCAGIRLNQATVTTGDIVRIVVPDGNKSAKLRAVYSYDRKNWQVVETQRAAFDFDVPLRRGEKAVYFATYYPYFHSQMVEHNRKLTKSRYVKASVIGKSVHGRDIPLLTITDPQSPETEKRRAFILGGTHGAETASIYGVEGMLDFLVSEDPLAAEMRRAVVWKIIPVHNVDAAAEGLDRRNAGGINLYFDWGFHEEMATRLATNAALKDDPSISRKDFSQPETRAAYDAIMAFQPQAFLDVHSWHFAGDGYWGPDPATTSPEIEALKQSIAKYFKIKQWDKEGWTIASAPTIARQLKIATTLPEFALCFDSDNNPKTPDSMRIQGTQILRGTYEYLKSLPQRAK